MSNIVIVESPAKAKTIEKYLGPDYKVMASIGHIRDLLPKSGSVNTDERYKMTWEISIQGKKVIKEIANTIQSGDSLYLATDPDREGEAISWQVDEVLKEKKKLENVNVKRITFGQGIYGTPVWSPRGDLIAFTKMYKNRFYIGVMRTDGSGERLLTENYYQEAPSWSPNGRVLIFYRETKSGSQGEGFSATLWSIDLTGYNERLIETLTDASDPSWSSLLTK